MADIVGTAYVRIKALTDNLAKDIKNDIKKELSGAKLDKVGEDVGEDLGDGIADGAEKTLKKRSKDIIPTDDILGGFVSDLGDFKNDIDDQDIFSGFRESFERNLDVDNQSIRRALEPLRDAREDIAGLFESVNFDLPFDEGSINNFFRRFRSNISDTRRDSNNFFGRLKSDLSSLGSELRTDVGQSMENFFTRARAGFRSLGNEIRDGDVGTALDDLATKFRNLGQGSGFNLGILRGAMLGIGAAIVAALPYIQDVGSAILAYATGLVAQIGSITTAVGGLGAAAIAALGSVAIAAIPIALAFKSETEALQTFKDAMAAAGEEFLRIGTATQVTLLPALDEAVFVLGDLVPMFQEFGILTGRSVGNFARLAAETLVGAEAQGRFRAIMQSSLHLLDVLTPTLINVGDILSGLWVAALPAAQRFAESLSTMVDRWSDLVTENLQSGELTRTFDTWYDRAETLGSALGNLSGALFDILQVGADSSDNVFIRFDQWAERFRDFTESEAGQNKLALIFDNALLVMREVNAVAADLFDGIFGRLAEVGGVNSTVEALQKFRDVIPEIKAFWDDAMTTIDEVVRLFASNVWEKITKAWEQMADPLGRLGTQLLDLLEVMNDSGAFEVFLDLMEILADVLSTLLAIPGLGQFIAYFVAFNAAIKVSTALLGPFVRLFGGFGSILIGLTRASAGAQLAGVAGGLQRFAAGVKAANAAGGMTTLAANATKAGAAAGGLAGKLGLAAAPLLAGGPLTIGLGVAAGALAIGGYAFFNHQKKVQEWQQEIRQATEALGLFNDGLLITAEGVTKYIETTSAFADANQLDDLKRLGIGVENLGKEIANGTISYEEFAGAALEAGEIQVGFLGNTSITKQWTDVNVSSLEELQRQYRLTAEEVDKLSEGEQVRVEGGTLAITQNDALIESFREVNRAIGAAAKENIDEFATNATNIAILGERTLARIRDDIKSSDDEEAGEKQREAIRLLNDEAKKLIPTFDVLDETTREQIHTQVQSADASVRAATEYQLLTDALEIQNEQIRENLLLFQSADFAQNFPEAKRAVQDFNTVLQATAQAGGFRNLDPNGDLDHFAEKLPYVGQAALTLFDTLKGLPQAEFDAAAQEMGLDADALRGAMEGAEQAIINLQEEALSKLPSIGELLDEATKVKEDGSQYFDTKGFTDSVNKRTQDTANFAANIKRTFEQFGLEAARLALQQGPEAAAALATMSAADAGALDAALAGMEYSEQVLTTTIRDVFGPAIAAQYLAQGDLIGQDFTEGITQGVLDPKTLAALQSASDAVLRQLANSFQGRFIILAGGEVKFVQTGGTYQRPTRTNMLSVGGYVGSDEYGSPFAGGPKGTDTVPAWLTPGEFVLRRVVAQAIPSKTLTALNAGDPRIMGLLTSLNKSRPGAPQSLVVSSAGSAAAARTAAPGISIGQMNIEAPEPLESARMVSDRLKILQSQLTRR